MVKMAPLVLHPVLASTSAPDHENTALLRAQVQFPCATDNAAETEDALFDATQIVALFKAKFKDHAVVGHCKSLQGLKPDLSIICLQLSMTVSVTLQGQLITKSRGTSMPATSHLRSLPLILRLRERRDE
ncbi:hypothetical protein NDU88_002078 [Pleurodeles waltl]|uniref:Uncharacterized protein n=1 Tax=Pleurodeles waltl TaxID=8319 RepID=A0AAV7R9V3_PLEWA|nr:hypothetical protein NDU88_002078 [Pleurodeles waltl]